MPLYPSFLPTKPTLCHAREPRFPNLPLRILGERDFLRLPSWRPSPPSPSWSSLQSPFHPLRLKPKPRADASKLQLEAAPPAPVRLPSLQRLSSVSPLQGL